MHPTAPSNGLTWQRALPYILLIGSLIGMSASFALTYDKIHVLQDPGYRPSCNLNPVLSCSSVMKTSQATILGVPNTLFGLIGFSMSAMFALVVLGGTQLKRWLWQGAQLAATAGVLSIHYLIFESVFRIHAICPWCFTVWVVTALMFFGITIYNVREGVIPAAHSKFGRFIGAYANDLVVLWYGVLLSKFWYYWKTLL